MERSFTLQDLKVSAIILTFLVLKAGLGGYLISGYLETIAGICFLETNQFLFIV